ncbi:MAG: hypothetical protein MJE77_02140 [Proteobacteria bacterium]|nr:hypothetical protein [Pseudomonadota bacterium]
MAIHVSRTAFSTASRSRTLFPAMVVAAATWACGGPGPAPVQPSSPAPARSGPGPGASHRAPGAVSPNSTSSAAPGASQDSPPPDRSAQPVTGGVSDPDPAGPVQPDLESAGFDCNRSDQFGPVELSPEEYARRRGAGIRNLALLSSSAEMPVEVCGVTGQQDFLLQAECADGSHPFSDRAAIRRARIDNVGKGGRCGAIIDRYRVVCPEKTHVVYMDMYVCLKGRSRS